ncbi:hypothetical protein F4553_006511 [Allocatelliglobosispora scoriae]|uniref:VCBS repeat-containing protein n=1 Tax=Allocatelliglobosispora scoriae TaxID=643052 RepID=A0A841BVG1_9ACTN|nr:hypothetical protein [Allocatelliglobosispora scoriae]MBB5873077.1 hypothetical protein [Allocatelliglobosispora scoriae]
MTTHQQSRSSARRRIGGAIAAAVTASLLTAACQPTTPQSLPASASPGSQVPSASASPLSPPPPQPSGPAVPLPTPVDRAPSGDPLTRLDWSTVTLRLVSDPSCPRGAVRFSRSKIAGLGTSSRVDRFPRASFQPDRVLVRDLDGDGRAEAVLHVYCALAADHGGDSTGRLLIVSRQTNGELRERGWATRPNQSAHLSAYWVAGGVLHVVERSAYATADYRIGQVQTYALTTGGVTYTGLAPAFPPVSPTGSLPLHITSALACGGGLPALAPGRLDLDSAGQAVRGDRTFSLGKLEAFQVGPHIVVGPSSRHLLLLDVGCAPTGKDGSTPRETLLAFARAADGWHEVTAYPNPRGYQVHDWWLGAGGTGLTIVFRDANDTSRQSTVKLPR